MDVIEAIYQRRAVRAYTDRPVEWAIVDSLLRAAVQAPSALNLQPWAFVVIQDRRLLNDLSRRVKANLLEADPADPRLRQLREVVASPDFDVFYGAGTLVVICAAVEHPNAAEDCALAGQNFMLAAYAAGLATCPIGLARPLLNQPELKARLDIPERFAPVLPIVLGYAKAEPTATPREPPCILSRR